MSNEIAFTTSKSAWVTHVILTKRPYKNNQTHDSMTQIKASINSNVCLLITPYMTIKEMGINPGNVKDIKYFEGKIQLIRYVHKYLWNKPKIS